MSENVNVQNASKELIADRRFKFFRRFISVPYLLALLGLLMPLMNVSCAEETIVAEPSFYQLATGVDLSQELKEPAKGMLQKMETGNPKALDKFRTVMPEFPKMNPVPHLYGIVGAIVLAAIFVWLGFLGVFANLASLTMGMLSMFSLWAFLGQMGQLCSSLGLPMMQVGPGTGLYCASFLILVGTAMNLAAIIRPILVEWKAKKTTKSK